MRKDQCLFCNRRKCSYRIASKLLTYDEVACSEHIEKLNKHSDRLMPNTVKQFLSSAGQLKRGEPLTWDSEAPYDTLHNV